MATCSSPCPLQPADARLAPGAIVIVAYQGADHIRRALESCRSHAEAGVIVVDNASTDGGRELVAAEFPEVRLLPQPLNLGFAAGCNVGIRAARAVGAQWVLLLNQDAAVEAHTVAALAAFLDSQPRAAAVQPALFRADGLVNSLGNPVHYLGFSAAGGNGLPLAEAERDPCLPWLRDRRWRTSGVTIPAFTGAAVMLRLAALDEVGLFEEELFLYHEDLELGLRLRRAGWTLHLLGSVRAVHHYDFSRNPRKWYFLERNRHWTLLAHYSTRSLAVLAIPLVAVESAVWAMAFRQGWVREKWQSYLYWLRPGTVDHLRRRRRELAAVGGISDRELLRAACGRLVATEVASPVVDRVVNPVSAVLWRVLRPLLR
jgi:GT2 family glycosyltransferase